MGKELEEILKARHTEAGKSLRKVVGSKGKLQGNLYFAGDGKKQAGVVITLLARDPKGQKALSAGKALRKGMSGAKFARGTVIMDGGKLVIELSAGTATAAMLKKAFKDDTFKKDPALKLLSRAMLRKKGAPGEADEVEKGTELDAEDLKVAKGAFSFGELTWIKLQQGNLDNANKELQASFLSVESAREEQAEQVAEIMDSITDFNEKLNAEVDAGDQAASQGYELLITSEQRKLAEAEAQGPDPFYDGQVDKPLGALLDRVQNAPLERAALDKAHNDAQSLRFSGKITSVLSHFLISNTVADNIRIKVREAYREADAREHFESVRLELDSALLPLITNNKALDKLIADKDAAEAKSAGQSLIASVQKIIDQAKNELEKVRVALRA